MPCKKSEFVSAVNAYASARVTQDETLISMSAKLLTELTETLEFASEEQGQLPKNEQG